LAEQADRRWEMRDLRQVGRAESDAMRDLRTEQQGISEKIPPAKRTINRLADPYHFVDLKTSRRTPAATGE
jgi:hypothetical protein